MTELGGMSGGKSMTKSGTKWVTGSGGKSGAK